MKIDAWKITESKYLIDDKWLRLRSDRCVTPSGALIFPYYVFEYPSWVMVFPVTKAGELVLVRQYRHAFGRMFLELPGGRLEAGDENAESAARRELAEETGYSGEEFLEIAQVAPDPARQTNLSHVVIATGLERIHEQQLGYGEELEVVLMPLDSVNAELKKGTFSQALHVSALYFGLSHLNMLR